jgi:hypothetical protein
LILIGGLRQTQTENERMKMGARKMALIRLHRTINDRRKVTDKFEDNGIEGVAWSRLLRAIEAQLENS